MAKFKKGDRVELIDNNLSEYGLRIGDQGTVDEDDSILPWVRWDKDLLYDLDRAAAYEEDLKLVERNMDNLQVDDVLVNLNANAERVVVEVLGKIIFTKTNTSTAIKPYTAEALEHGGWKLKGTEPELNELTLDQIAEKFSLPVETLRIKKEA